MYHHTDPNKKAFGAQVRIEFHDGTSMQDSIERANAHPGGARPFVREHYLKKFHTLTGDLIDPKEAKRFIDLAENLKNLSAKEVQQLNVVMNQSELIENLANQKGIF